jgi:steroid 5-alpha reductase family enzyme
MIMQIITESLLILAVYMTLGYLIAQIKKDTSLVDIFWGTGFIILAWYSLFKTELFLPRQLVVTTLITLWGVRLTGYILWRKKGDDPRYISLKKQWGSWAPVYIFIFIFMLQGLFVLLIDYPVLLINSSTLDTFQWTDYLGVTLWVLGISYEAIADWQLHAFLQNQSNKGLILQSGLWKYSRHPNYFGELVLWTGIWFLAITVPYGWTGIISPLTLVYIFLFISIPVTERHMLSNSQFIAYKEKTNMIIPFFKK